MGTSRIEQYPTHYRPHGSRALCMASPFDKEGIILGPKHYSSNIENVRCPACIKRIVAIAQRLQQRIEQ